MKNEKKRYNLIGCCGISCGLCPRYQSKAKSCCLGCVPDDHCKYCSIYKCCTKKHHFETCADCGEFPCNKFSKWFDKDSFVTHQKCLSNIQNIKTIGFDEFLKEQEERKEILEIMLEKYNPGRSMSFYCLASALINIESLNKSINKMENTKEDKPKLLKQSIQELAEKENVILKLRK
ncbi:DUF3795 domain-containing protein [Thermodesulfobacteriota bacterium]